MGIKPKSRGVHQTLLSDCKSGSQKAWARSLKLAKHTSEYWGVFF